MVSGSVLIKIDVQIPDAVPTAKELTTRVGAFRKVFYFGYIAILANVLL